MIFFFYRYFVSPLAWLIFQTGYLWGSAKWKRLLHAKAHKRWTFRGPALNLTSTHPFWIHAASGEIEYAKPVIRELKKKYPYTPIVVTYSSPSAIKLIEKETDIDAYRPLPWESMYSYSLFFARFQPRALLIARTDAWPILCAATRRQKIPILMFAATFAASSSRLSRWMRSITQKTLAMIQEIHVVSESDFKNLDGLVPEKKIKIYGDTRFEQVRYRLQHPKIDIHKYFSNSRENTLVAGSTWPEDEKVLVQAIAENPNWNMIIAPHEIDPDHLSKLEKLLDTAHLSHQRFSHSRPWTSRVMILDHVGILAEIYQAGSLSFVGGSFKKNVHSVMEPLAAGIPVIVGPYHQNNREALRFRELPLESIQMVHPVSSAADLSSLLKAYRLTIPSQKIIDEIDKQVGASSKVLEWCHRATT